MCGGRQETFPSFTCLLQNILVIRNTEALKEEKKEKIFADRKFFSPRRMTSLSFGRLLGFVVFAHCGQAFHMTGLPFHITGLPVRGLHYTNACTMRHQRLRMCIGESVSGARTVDGSGEFDPVRVVSVHDERFKNPNFFACAKIILLKFTSIRQALLTSSLNATAKVYCGCGQRMSRCP